MQPYKAPVVDIWDSADTLFVTKRDADDFETRKHEEEESALSWAEGRELDEKPCS